MKYDITKPTAPAMTNLGKGIECFKLLLSQTSQDMNAPLLPMLSPLLGTRICQAEFQYPRPHLEGADGHDGQSGGRFGLQQGPIVLFGGGYLSRLPSARQGGNGQTRGMEEGQQDRAKL